MSMIVPWTSPNGTPCCCNPCNEDQPSTYSAVQLSADAHEILRADSNAQAVLLAGIDLNVVANADYGAEAGLVGTMAIQSTTASSGGCSTDNGFPSWFYTVYGINCTRTNPTRTGVTYTLTTQSCLNFLGGLGRYNHNLDQDNMAYINIGASFSGVVQYVWNGVDGDGASVGNITASVTYNFGFLTQNAGTNGFINFVVGGETFQLPVIYGGNVSSTPVGSLNPNISSWSGTPTLTYTPSAP